MSEPGPESPYDTAEQEAASPKPPSRWRKWTTRLLAVLTAAWGVTLVSAHVFLVPLEENTGLGLDVVNFLTVITGTLLVLIWALWALFVSGWRWYTRLAAAAGLILAPMAFFSVVQPHGGDLNHWVPVWQLPEELPAEVQISTDDTVDLTPEAPDDFPQFLGPNRNGVISTESRIDPDKFSDSELLWRQPVGRGWSGFVVRNGYAITTEQRSEMECVSCYRVEDGELCWVDQHPARHRDQMNLGHTGPRATPLIDAGRVYSVGAVGRLVCLDGSDGAVIWERDLNELLGLTLATAVDSEGLEVVFEADSSLAWGRSGSPLIHNNRLIVPGGGPRSGPKKTLLAFDLQTGELLAEGGNAMIAYGSPVVATIAGREQILLTAEHVVMGFDADTLQVLWTADRPGPSDGEANTSQVTVVSGNTVLTSKGYPDGGSELLSVSCDENGCTAEVVWNNPRLLKTKLTSPVVSGDYAWALSNGFLECARVTDGKQMWKRRGRFGHGQLLLVNDQLLVHTEEGRMLLIDADPQEYIERGKFDTVDGICWNQICLAGDLLLVRSDVEAACFRLPLVSADASAP